MPLRVGGPPLGGYSAARLQKGGVEEAENASEAGSFLSAVPTQIGGLPLGGAYRNTLTPVTNVFQLLEVELACVWKFLNK